MNIPIPQVQPSPDICPLRLDNQVDVLSAGCFALHC